MRATTSPDRYKTDRAKTPSQNVQKIRAVPILDRIHLMRIVGNPRNFAIADFGFGGPWVGTGGAVVALRHESRANRIRVAEGFQTFNPCDSRV